MNTVVANTVEKIMGDRPALVETQYKEDPSGEKMLATRWYGTRDVRVESVPKPTLTEPKDVIVKVSLHVVPRTSLRPFLRLLEEHSNHQSWLSLRQSTI